MSGFHSGMFGLRNLRDRVDELPPVIALRGEDALALGRQTIEAPPAFAGLLDPLARNPSPFLEPVEQRIERRDLEFQASAGALLDQLADLVAVARARVHEREDQELGAAFLQFALEHPRDMFHSDIFYSGCQPPSSNLLCYTR